MLTIPPALDVAGENAAMRLNTGEMKNTGWEVSVGYNSPRYGDFSWNGSFNISQYKNKLVRLNSMQKFIGGDVRLIPGEAMGVYYGYVCDGIFRTKLKWQIMLASRAQLPAVLSIATSTEMVRLATKTVA